MARKRLGGKPGEAPEDDEAEKVAREIGRLQKQAREIERSRPPPPPPTDFGPRRLFSGGARESHEGETADEPFRAADLLRSEQPGETLRQRNEAKLLPFVGKEIKLRVRFDALRRGGLERENVQRTRTLTFQSYDGLVAAYQDVMRQSIEEESEAAYYVETIDFEPTGEPGRKQCAATKRDGKQCTRYADGRSKFCWQHRKRRRKKKAP